MAYSRSTKGPVWLEHRKARGRLAGGRRVGKRSPVDHCNCFGFCGFRKLLEGFKQSGDKF